MIIKGVLLQIFISLLPFIMFNVYYKDKTKNYSKKFITGASSLSLILSMTFSLSIMPGVIYDARYVILFFALVFGGLQTGFILLLEFVLYRFCLGGAGKWVGMISIAITFPVSIIFYKIYEKARYYFRISLIFVFGLICSIIPRIVMYLYNPDFITNNLGFNLFIVPALHCFEIWLLIFLFDKAVSDKNFFIKHIEDEKVRTIGHVAASLVHEVRNPLTTMKGFLTLINQNTLDRNKVERYIQICMDEINRTETILSEYLTISKPLTEREKEQTDLSRILEITLDIMTPYANMNNVLIEVDKPIQSMEIFANPEEIKQILVNFIKNSIEACFNIQDGKVSLRLKEENTKIILEIEDNGIGMNEDQVRRLGTIYYSTKARGTGLGLTFSYQVIRALGGSISVQSEPGVGTAFKITFLKDKEIQRYDAI
ncbi:sensor histidine kinase [Paenibacillus sp. GP183]|jgi:two-component system sporulation sensor kinase B|uniref:ATP-binding protein n=1 Tax=Paenibacillus sp. GP183 TaxID=1882751 RepID=UPI00089C203B|nr:sensor histidine kinase [Paenibacillus sp. GP183]SEB42662.1 two-component system, sporulation sensor kinase B [Paenibacillus sp. GP183]